VGIWGLARIATAGTRYTLDYFTAAKSNQLNTITTVVADEYAALYDAAKAEIDAAPEALKKPLSKMKELVGKGVSGGGFGKYATKIDNDVTLLPKEVLFGNDALTFLDEEYRTVQTAKVVTTYRSFGYKAKLGGTFATSSEGASRSELAILDEWNNSMRFEAVIMIPSNTKLNIGKVAPQVSTNGLQTLEGGADQFILPYKWSNSWVVKITDKTTGKIYLNAEEFKVDFPDLVD